MATIPTNQLAYIRNQVSGLLTQTCTLKTKSPGVDVNGDPNSSYGTIATGIACRVLPSRSGSTSDAELIANKQIIGDVVRIVLPYDTTIDAGYEIHVDSTVYTVISLLDSRAQETDRQVIATVQR